MELGKSDNNQYLSDDDGKNSGTFDDWWKDVSTEKEWSAKSDRGSFSVPTLDEKMTINRELEYALRFLSTF